jgi:4-amino-4-deoxy-L-arabinose transferase-like glycosyltransferase
MELCDDSARRLVRPSVRLTPARALIVLAVLVTLARLAFGAAMHLTEDEAYYRLWALHPQAGYLDHPPMIAWWIRAGMALFGDTPLGVRLLPALATGLTTWLLGDGARRLGLSETAALRTGLWYNATFTVGLGGMLATPDTPTCLFWTLCLWCLARARDERRDFWWAPAGLAAGLCCLSKYSGFFLAPGVLLWLALTPNGFAVLRRPWPWAGALLAVAAFAPNLAWNAAHGWMTFDKQFGRVAGHGLRPAHLPEFLVTQFLLLNPLIALLAGRGIVQAWRRRALPEGGAILPLALAAPFLVYLTVHSLHDRVQGHWPAPAFGALVLCAALAGESLTPAWRRATTVVGLGLCAVALTYAALPLRGGFGAADPTAPIRNWGAFAQEVESRRQAAGATWVGADSYGVLAQLAGETAIKAPLVQINERERYFDWDRGAAVDGPGLVVDLDRRLSAPALQRCFRVVEPAGRLARGSSGKRSTLYAAYRVEGQTVALLSQGCPESPGQPSGPVVKPATLR